MALAAPSDAVRLMLAPAREYRQRVAARRTATWPRALTVPVLLVLMIGLLNSTAAVGHVAGLLVLDTRISHRANNFDLDANRQRSVIPQAAMLLDI